MVHIKVLLFKSRSIYVGIGCANAIKLKPSVANVTH